MWRVNKLHLVNFMSYEDQVIEFKQKEATIIQGVNLTDEGFENNGSGKSAILEALSVVLLNTTLRRQTTSKDLVRRGEKQSSLLIELTNSITKDKVEISREIFSNTKSSTLNILINGIKEENIVSVRDGDKYILNLIGISKEDLLNYFLVSSEKFESFFSVSDRAKKDLIGRFSNSNIVDSVIESLKTRKSQIDESLLTTSNNLIGTNSTIESYEELIVQKQKDKPETKVGFTKKVNDKITETKEDIKRLESKKTLDNNAKDEKSLQLVDLETEVKGLKKKKQVYVDKLEELDTTRSKSLKTQRDTETILQKLELKLLKVIECPSCEFKFNPNSKEEVDTKVVQNNIDIAKKYIETLKKSIDSIDKKKETVIGKRRLVDTDLSTKGVKVTTLTNEINTITGSISLTGSKITTSNNLVAELKKSLESFQEVDLSQVIRDLRVKVEKEKEKRDTLEKEKKVFEKNLETSLYWILTFTRFKTHLSNKVIKVIECFINEYLSRMNTDIVVAIDGYKMNKDNTIKESISVSLHRGSEDGNLFTTYSNGERARVEIAAIFAIQKLINTSIKESSGTGGLEFTFLDEIIDSVDSKGMFNIMKTLQTLEKTISVISHVVFKEHSPDMFNTLTATKINKISTIQ